MALVRQNFNWLLGILGLDWFLAYLVKNHLFVANWLLQGLVALAMARLHVQSAAARPALAV